MHPVFLLRSEERVVEQVWSERRGQMYLTGCASECKGRNVQTFVVRVEGVEVTSANS